MRILRTEANKILGNALLRHAESEGHLKAQIIDGRHYLRKEDIMIVLKWHQNGDLKWKRHYRGFARFRELFAPLRIGPGLEGDFSDIDEIERQVRQNPESAIMREVTRRYGS